MVYLGDFPTGATVYVPFHTFDSSGASVTLTGLAVTDLEVYKDGSATQRASDSGYALLDTDGIDFDSITGIHAFSIDLSDNTDSGFFAAGSDYWIVVSSVTVDGQTVNFVAATFSIENRWPSAANNADAVWDEVITGAQHNVNNSAAKFLREASEAIALTGTAQSATSTTLVLESGAVTADDIFNGERVTIIEGTGLGQSRLITDSVASSDTVTVAHGWTTNPDNTSVYAIMGAEVDVRAVAEQAVTATGTVNYDKIGDIATAAATSDAVWTEAIADHSGTSGSTAEALDAAGGGVTAAAIADAVWDETMSAHTTSGSTGAKLNSITAGSVTYAGPVAPATGNVTVTIGDDYSNDDSRALEWTSSSWPNLTNAQSITLVVEDGTASDGTDWSITLTAPTAGAGSQTIRAQPTKEQTELLVEGTKPFQIEAVLATSGNIVTLVEARWTSKDDIA